MKNLDLNNTETLDLSNFDGEEQSNATGYQKYTSIVPTVVRVGYPNKAKLVVSTNKQPANKGFNQKGEIVKKMDADGRMKAFVPIGTDRKRNIIYLPLADLKLSSTVSAPISVASSKSNTPSQIVKPIMADVEKDPVGTVYKATGTYMLHPEQNSNSSIVDINGNRFYTQNAIFGSTAKFTKYSPIEEYVQIGFKRGSQSGSFTLPVSGLSKEGFNFEKDIHSYKVGEEIHLLNNSKMYTTSDKLYLVQFFRGFSNRQYGGGSPIQVAEGINDKLINVTATNAAQLNADRASAVKATSGKG